MIEAHAAMFERDHEDAERLQRFLSLAPLAETWRRSLSQRSTREGRPGDR